MLRSPTEYESTPVIGHCLQEYFLKLLGNYREFVEVDSLDGDDVVQMSTEPVAIRRHTQDDGYLRYHSKVCTMPATFPMLVFEFRL